MRWLGDGPDNLLRAERVALGSDEHADRWRAVRDTQLRQGRHGEVRIEVEGIETREAAAAHTGLFVVGDAARLATLPPGEHYWYEWIGCSVTTSEGRRLGVVREIWDAGAHDVLVIEEEETRRERLVPVVGALLRDVDVAARRIVMDVPQGLLDDAEPS